MKLKIKFSKRSNLMVTLIACASALVMMVVRFGYPADKMVQIFWITLLMLALMVLVAALFAWLIRWLVNLNDDKSSDDISSPGKQNSR